jgi:hypothetical protein
MMMAAEAGNPLISETDWRPRWSHRPTVAVILRDQLTATQPKLNAGRVGVSSLAGEYMLSTSRKPSMADDRDYNSLSKRFESFAQRASDPLLADAYRKLAHTYRALDIWHERFRQRYEESAGTSDADDSVGGGRAAGKPVRDEE